MMKKDGKGGIVAHCDKIAALRSELIAAGLPIDDGAFYELHLVSLPRSLVYVCRSLQMTLPPTSRLYARCMKCGSSLPTFAMGKSDEVSVVVYIF